MRRLDDWYKTINGIYLDRNFYRSLESVYLHFIEVTGVLCLAGDPRRKRHIDPESYLPKALAWFLATCGRAGIPSVEKMIWAKYPNVCPYCLQEQHDPTICKESKQQAEGKRRIDWKALAKKANENMGHMPETLAGWQSMFNRIYRRGDTTDQELNIKRLGEEKAETAEAVRAITVAPRYIIAEAPDLFGWLMGFANQFDFDRDPQIDPDGYGQHLEERMEEEYPDGCKLCGYSVCKCPPIHPDTLGRIAKLGPTEGVFEGKRGLFSVFESISYFSKALRGVKIEEHEYSPQDTEYKDFGRYLTAILEKLDGLTNISMSQVVGLTQVVAKTEVLVQQGTAMNEDVDQLLEFIRQQPSETRRRIADFFINLGASGAFGALTVGFTKLLEALL